MQTHNPMKINTVAQTLAPPFPAAPRSRRGFTLTELLVVIAIIIVLAATSFTVVGKMREQARSSACLGNLKQVGTIIKLDLQLKRVNKTRETSFKL